MGAAFVNLQVNTPSESIPETLIPKGYVKRQTAGEWVSVYEEKESFEWNKMSRLGKKISKECAVCVIAVSFFDEDEFSMELYKDGKTIGFYRINLSQSFSKGSTKWIEELKLSGEEAGAFRYLLKKEMLPMESIHVFSRLLGVRLYGDLRMLEEEPKLWQKDAENVIAEIGEEKKRSRIKNRTRANLIQEFPGLFESCDERSGVLRMVYPDGKGNFTYGHIHCLEICENGLWEIHDFQYPSHIFGKDCGRLLMDYEHNEISVFIKGKNHCYMYDLKTYEEELNRLMRIPGEKRQRKDNLPKVNRVGGNNAIDEGRYEYSEGSESGRWDSGRSGIVLKKVDLETSGKTFAEKNVVASYEYEEPDWNVAFWDFGWRPVITEKGVVNSRLKYLKGTKNAVCDVRFFDKNLKLLRKEEIELKNAESGWRKSAYCENMDYVFIDNKRINLKNHEVKEGAWELRDMEDIFVESNKAGETYLYGIRRSTVYVFDLDLNLKSCHRLKDRILYFYKNEKENVCLITGRYIEEDDRPDKNAAVRVYEIEW